MESNYVPSTRRFIAKGAKHFHHQAVRRYAPIIIFRLDGLIISPVFQWHFLLPVDYVQEDGVVAVFRGNINRLRHLPRPAERAQEVMWTAQRANLPHVPRRVARNLASVTPPPNSTGFKVATMPRGAIRNNRPPFCSILLLFSLELYLYCARETRGRSF